MDDSVSVRNKEKKQRGEEERKRERGREKKKRYLWHGIYSTWMIGIFRYIRVYAFWK
jgi:hypothetical protein